MINAGDGVGAAPQLPPARVPAGAAEALARRILAEPRFTPARPSLWDRLTAWVATHLGDIVDHLLGGGSSAVSGWVVIAVVLTAVVVGVARFGSRVRRDPGLPGLDGAPVGRPARDWLAEAGTRAAAGEWRDALRCRYRALVVGLAEAGVLDEVPGRTTREHVRLVAERSPDAEAGFAAATELFEGAWYGDRAIGPDDDALLEELRARVLRRARRPEPVGAGAP